MSDLRFPVHAAAGWCAPCDQDPNHERHAHPPCSGCQIVAGLAANAAKAAEKRPQSVDYQQLIADTCDELKAFLLEKNRRYGSSMFEPVRIFSKASADEQIRVRLDDKLSRIVSGQPGETEDVPLDLTGYLIGLLALRRLERGKAVMS